MGSDSAEANACAEVSLRHAFKDRKQESRELKAIKEMKQQNQSSFILQDSFFLLAFSVNLCFC